METVFELMMIIIINKFNWIFTALLSAIGKDVRTIQSNTGGALGKSKLLVFRIEFSHEIWWSLIEFDGIGDYKILFIGFKGGYNYY